MSLLEASEADSKEIPAPRGRRQESRKLEPVRRESLSNKRPVIEWAAWVAGLTLLISVTAGKFMLKAVSSDSTGLALFILVAFFLSIVKSFLDARYMDAQFRVTDKQIQDMWKANNIRDFLAHTASDGIFRQHIANLFQICRRDYEVSQDNLIELLHAKLKARIRALEIIGSVLVTLGLIGTILGLIAAVSGLSLAMHAAGENDTAVMSGMNQTLGGMGTAFFTTLLGAVCGGVFLRLVSSNLRGNVDHLVAHIAELTEVYILPVLRFAAREREAEQKEKASCASDKNPNSSTSTSRSAI